MITRFGFQNFKSLRDVRVDVGRLTVFVGPNASGKSSSLQGMEGLCRAAATHQMQLSQVPADMQKSASFGLSGSVSLTAEVNGKAFRLIAPADKMSPYPPLQPGVSGSLAWEVAADLEASNWTRPPRVAIPLPKSVLLRLEASKLVVANAVSQIGLIPFANPNSDNSGMNADGLGVHSALANMALNDPDSWHQLQADLRGIIPTIRRLRHTKTGPNQPPSLLFDTIGADGLDATQVSEGTLLVLGLLTALYAPSRPNLMLLDDIDRGLHPRAQRDLVKLLRRLLDTNAELQIVATTHSPYLLDCVEPDEVRMTCLRDDGSTVCAPLTANPDFDKWKDEMAPGEMWSLFGEKWLLDAGATV